MDGTITVAGTLIGTLSGTVGLRGTLSTEGVLIGTITLGAGAGYPEFEGSYEVTPTLSEQTLATNNTHMSDDVTVHRIPITYTSNIYDGKTVLIG